ncbi:MAG: response regulator transcription factor [Phycisphaerales bacterium]|jgi:DNA-binding NarL/FixJ family response regulator|nr:response regulator transcription factor [Phycisphaerales bacterium]
MATHSGALTHEQFSTPPAHRGPEPLLASFLLVDDHPVVIHALRHIIHSRPGWKVVSQCETPEQARTACREFRPDIVFLDLMFPGESGLDFLGWLHAELPRTRSIVYSIQPDTVYAPTCIRAGAAGYVGKSVPVEVIVTTASMVLEGSTVVNGNVINRRAAGFAGGTAVCGLNQLSRRELEVLNLIGQGYSNKRIAEIICRSAKTVESHRYRISRKLKIDNGPALMRFAMQHQLANEAIAQAVHRGVSGENEEKK